jgi:spore coat polysaccharide biosynthesis protein SpsF
MRCRKKLKIAIIIEARMTSTRLPGKIMLGVLDKPLLGHMIERVKRSRLADEIVIATTTNKEDDPVVTLGIVMGVKVFRGSELDVLKRVLDAAKSVKADIIVELTGDCPLNDPRLIDRAISKYLEEYPAYNYVQLGGFWGRNRTLPNGFGASVFSTKDLSFIERSSRDPLDREHVSLPFYSGKYPFKIFTLLFRGALRWPELTVTLDTKEDYQLIRVIFENLYKNNPNFSCLDVINFLKKNPHLLKINKHITRRYVKV